MQEGMMAVFFPPFLLQCITKAKFSSSGGAFVSFEEFIFFFFLALYAIFITFQRRPLPVQVVERRIPSRVSTTNLINYFNI